MEKLNCNACGSNYLRVEGNLVICESCDSRFTKKADPPPRAEPRVSHAPPPPVAPMPVTPSEPLPPPAPNVKKTAGSFYRAMRLSFLVFAISLAYLIIFDPFPRVSYELWIMGTASAFVLFIVSAIAGAVGKSAFLSSLDRTERKEGKNETRYKGIRLRNRLMSIVCLLLILGIAAFIEQDNLNLLLRGQQLGGHLGRPQVETVHMELDPIGLRPVARVYMDLAYFSEEHSEFRTQFSALIEETLAFFENHGISLHASEFVAQREDGSHAMWARWARPLPEDFHINFDGHAGIMTGRQRADFPYIPE